MIESFLAAVSTRETRVAVIGLGYVGLPLALSFAEAGFPVIGLDIDASKIDKLERGETYIEHIPSERIAAAQEKFSAAIDFSEAAAADAIIICVPTPLTKFREPDLSFIIGTMDSLLPHLRAGQLICLESTTYPGTTDEVLKPSIEARGLRVGTDVLLAFSPEREDPGNAEFNTRTIPKVCGGVTPDCLKAASALYGAVIDRVVQVSSTRAAELTKLLENIHRAVNIGLVNEMKIIADHMGIDIHEVIQAAATKPFGFVPYYPGPGLGGHCIPIDPFYLTWKARQFGLHTRFIELAGEINHAMPQWVMSKLAQALNERSMPIKGTSVLVLGIAYKKNVGDMRESPAVELMHMLIGKGAIISYSDPHVPVFPEVRRGGFDLSSVPITAERLSEFDVVLLATDHAKFDYGLIKAHSKLIIDTRGVYLDPAENVVKA